MENVFGRIYPDNKEVVHVLYVDDGCAVNTLDADCYQLDSNMSVRHYHADGVRISVADATALGLEIETVIN